MDPTEPRVNTDGVGFYQFLGLVPGDYVLRQVPPQPYVQSSPLGDGAIRVNLPGLTNLENLDFGNRILPLTTRNDFDVDFSVTQGQFDFAPFCPGHYNEDVHWSPAGRGENVAQWTFSGLTPGVYRVLLTWSARADRATNAPFTVLGTAGEPSVTVRINQQIKPSDMEVDNITNGFAFVEIVPEFEVYGDKLIVQLTNDANGYVIADAVQIQRLDIPVARMFSGSQTLWDDESTFDFGTMNVGSVADRSFTISNVGSMPLTLGSTWSLPAGYSVKTPPASYQLAVGQSVSFVLSRNTSTAGDGIGTFSIPIGNRPHDPYNITLRGLVHESTSVVIDDGDAGFSLAGYWNQANIGYQNDVRYSAAGSRSEANWVFSGLTAGATYQVWATWPEHINRATNVPFTIQGATTTSGVLNQRLAPDDLQLYGKGWERLGTTTLGSSTLQVKFSSGSDGFLVADAVRVVMVGQPELQVQVAGTVLPGPGTNVPFGATKVGSPIVKTVTLKNVGTFPVTWGGTITVPGGFVASPPSTTTLNPNESTSFQVSLAATQAGSYSGAVKFTSNTVTKSEFSFLSSGSVDVPVTNYEQIVDDGDAAYTSNAGWVLYSGIGRGSDVRYAAAGSGSAVSSWTFTGLTPFAPVVVSASWAAHPNRASNSPYRVYNDTISASNLLLERRVDQRLVPDDGNRQGTDWEWLGVVTPTSSRLVVTLANDANAFVLADAIEVRSGGGPEIVIEGDNQALYDGVSAMNFGTTAVGQPITKNLTIRNVGGAPLSLQMPTLPTGFAIIGSMPTSVAPGAGASFTVALTATSAGSFGGLLKVPSNDADENPFDISFSGIVQNELPQIIDDGATGFTSTGFTNYAGIGYQSDVRYAAAGTGSSFATWSFPVVAGGVYRISTTWVIHSNRATDAPFSVFDGTTATGKLLGTTRLNQQVNPNDFSNSGVAWEDVGVFAMSGTTLTVRLTNQANQFVIADAVRIERVNPLQVNALPQGERATSSLTQSDLDRMLAAASTVWIAAGVSAEQKTQLANATASVRELPGNLLGAATSVGLMIDPHAAGWGWYVGSTNPNASTAVPAGSIDLLTVVTHELGHKLGLPDLHDEATADELMHAVLAPGVRRLPSERRPTPVPSAVPSTAPSPVPSPQVQPETLSIADFWQQAGQADRFDWLDQDADQALWNATSPVRRNRHAKVAMMAKSASPTALSLADRSR